MDITLYNKLIQKETCLSLTGLGYVGMPIAVAFAEICNVIGFDTNKEKIRVYKSGKDPTSEVGDEKIRQTQVKFTDDETCLKAARFHIVAVPTPINADHTPDLTAIRQASRTLGRNLARGSVVVYESTVYPGVTEDICIPILEQESGLTCGVDFKAGYSPERINPGDREHRLETIPKIVSATDQDALETIAKVYGLVVKAGIYQAESIKVAEAAKVIENSQRDINIAFMNELSIIFHKLGIDTRQVLRAAETKWNFLNFYPGLVGGHCIGVDPYYLTYKAEETGYHSQVILSGRRINDGMGHFVAESLVKLLIAGDKSVKNARVAILGFTFKENCPDSRNTKVMDIINELKEYGISPVIVDAQADADEAERLYQIRFQKLSDIRDMDVVIIAVAHNEFCGLSRHDISRLYGAGTKILMDLKGILPEEKYEGNGYVYWRL